MIVTFCGHADFVPTPEHERTLLAILEDVIGDAPAELYLGDHGAFDSFARSCGRTYQMTHPNVTLVLVTPYLHAQYESGKYDHILYPGLENVPLRFAISQRNRWMMRQAAVVVAYVTHSWGGAYQTYRYAKSQGKLIYNLKESEDNAL